MNYMRIFYASYQGEVLTTDSANNSLCATLKHTFRKKNNSLIIYIKGANPHAFEENRPTSKHQRKRSTGK